MRCYQSVGAVVEMSHEREIVVNGNAKRRPEGEEELWRIFVTAIMLQVDMEMMKKCNQWSHAIGPN